MEPGATLRAIRVRPALGAAGLAVVAHGFVLLPLVHGAFHDRPHDHGHRHGEDADHEHGHDHDEGVDHGPSQHPDDHGDDAPEHLGVAITAVPVFVVRQPAVRVEPTAPLPLRSRAAAPPARMPRQPRAPPA